MRRPVLVGVIVWIAGVLTVCPVRCAVPRSKYSVQTLQHISANTRLQAIMLAGDLSYADLDEQRWDSWGKLVTVSRRLVATLRADP